MTGALIVNPFCELTVSSDEASGPDLLIGACVRGSSTRYTLLRRSEDPELYAELERFARRGAAYASCKPIVADVEGISRWQYRPAMAPRLRRMGLLIAPVELARRVRYVCSLGSTLPRLLPKSLVKGMRLDPSWIVHPGYLFTGAGKSMSTNRATGLPRSSACWPPDEHPLPSVWLQDFGTKVRAPMWPSRQFSVRARRLVPGHPPRGLDERSANALRNLGILVQPAVLAERRSMWARLKSEGKRELKERGYLVVRTALLAFQVAALRRYYRRMIKEGFMPFVDKDVGRRFVSHDDSVATYFLHQFVPLMQRAVGRRVLPTHVSLAAYQGGARLPTHRDGPTSDWNISLQVDFVPEPRGLTPWPLVMGAGTNEEVSVYLGLGDAVLYQGNRLPHGRPKLGERQQSTLLVFHYCDPTLDVET